MKILGIDPGTATTGYGLVEKIGGTVKYIACGVILTEKNTLSPDRLESKYAPRPFLGMNFRMTELSGAVLLAQLRKLDLITSHLRANKAIVKSILEEVPTIDFQLAMR